MMVDEKRLGDVIAEELGSRNEDAFLGEVVTKWITIAEVYPPAGKPYLKWVASDSMQPWDARGILLSTVDELDPPSVVLAGRRGD